jgi:LEA14-like dessication related protein
MNKILLTAGLGLAGFGLYRYFKNQIDLAMNYTYDIQSLKTISQTADEVTMSVDVLFTNKSNFEITIKEYYLNLFYKDIPFASSKSVKEFTILPNTTLSINVLGTFSEKESKSAILPFLYDIANRKAINIKTNGYVKTVFLKIPYTINLDNVDYQYSKDLIADYGLATPYEKLKSKYPKIFSILGVK